MSGSAVAQEWTRRLDADGAVDFERSWGKVALHALRILAFIASGVAMIAFGDGDGALPSAVPWWWPSSRRSCSCWSLR